MARCQGHCHSPRPKVVLVEPVHWVIAARSEALAALREVSRYLAEATCHTAPGSGYGYHQAELGLQPVLPRPRPHQLTVEAWSRDNPIACARARHNAWVNERAFLRTRLVRLHASADRAQCVA